MFTTSKPVGDFARIGFNDRASSVVVEGGRWEACEDARFGGHCAVLKQGSYESLRGMGLDDRISSVRPVDARTHSGNETPEPLAAPTYDYRRRPHERVYEARVTSVRAVRGQPEARCWTEHHAGNESHHGGADGAFNGGVLGHQAGSGHGDDVRRCETTSSETPAYWDVTYDFRGTQHRVQMGAPPSRTVSVNQAGEPRG